MLSYPIDEAETLLSTKLSTAQTSLSHCEEDLDFLREQITVRISRAYPFHGNSRPNEPLDDGSRDSQSL